MTVEEAQDRIRNALDDAGVELLGDEYDALLEWLAGEAECRRMARREDGED